MRQALTRPWFGAIPRLVAVGVMVVLGCFGPATAQVPDDARQAAIKMWLADQELDGLRALADLARAGDAASQLLLGLIDKSTEFQGPALVALSRAERLALLRAPGGMSGRNWVHSAAAQGNTVALAWQALWQMSAGLDTAKSFARLAERRALAEALLTLVKRHETGFSPEVLASEWYPDTLLMLSQTRVLRESDAARLHPGDPQQRFGPLAAQQEDALPDWLEISNIALPLRETCAAQCPKTQEACVMALYTALGDYEALLTFGSPVAGLVPDAEFAASPRGQAALARRIMLMRSTRMRDAQRLELAQLDACAADWLARTYEAYSLHKIPAAQ